MIMYFKLLILSLYLLYAIKRTYIHNRIRVSKNKRKYTKIDGDYLMNHTISNFNAMLIIFTIIVVFKHNYIANTFLKVHKLILYQNCSFAKSDMYSKYYSNIAISLIKKVRSNTHFSH